MLPIDLLSYLHYNASMYQINIEPTEVFKALSDRTRLRILRILVSMPQEEVCLCELTEALQESEANVSRHLKALRQSGLLVSEKEGRWVYHRLVPSRTMEIFYQVISDLPDRDGIYKSDLSKYKLEIKKRTSDRCRKALFNSKKRTAQIQKSL